MERKIYVEDLQIIEELGVINDSAMIIERDCEELGFFFSQDDMGNIYISRNEDCESFEEVEF